MRFRQKLYAGSRKLCNTHGQRNTENNPPALSWRNVAVFPDMVQVQCFFRIAQIVLSFVARWRYLTIYKPECNKRVAHFAANDVNSAVRDREAFEKTSDVQRICRPGQILQSYYHAHSCFSTDFCKIKWKMLADRLVRIWTVTIIAARYFTWKGEKENMFWKFG